MMAAVLDAIEPAAREVREDGASDELIAFASIAISMKRIADALDWSALGIDMTESLSGLTYQMVRRS